MQEYHQQIHADFLNSWTRRMLLDCHICISLYWPLETITTPIFVGQEKYLIQGDYYLA